MLPVVYWECKGETMKRLYLAICLAMLFSPVVSYASIPQIKTPYPISELTAQIKKVLNAAYESLIKEDSKQEKSDSEDEHENTEASPSGEKNSVDGNKSNIESSEYPPYAGEALRKELEKKEPSIPAVETILKQEYIYQSDTLTKDKKSGSNDELQDGSLEKLQYQTILTYENARALARRTLDLITKAEDDEKDLEADNKKRTTTGSIQKGLSSASIYRTHMMLNEIAVLRNSYIEINAINIVQGTEAPKKKGLVESALGAVTGGF